MIPRFLRKMTAGKVGAHTLTRLKSECLTGVGAHISAAHRDQNGVMHGHTWTIRAWWIYSPGRDAIALRGELVRLLAVHDHKALPDALATGEGMARYIADELDCHMVEVSREPEQIFARWPS